MDEETAGRVMGDTMHACLLLYYTRTWIMGVGNSRDGLTECPHESPHQATRASGPDRAVDRAASHLRAAV